MEPDFLQNTKRLMQRKAADRDFDSYAVYVKIGADESTFCSDNVDEDTYFDIASLGKVLVTTPLVLQTTAGGLLRLDSRLDEWFENVPSDKKGITVRQLLTHTSGIVRHIPPREVAAKGRDAVAENILSHALAFAPGSDYLYSCCGMVLLGFILEKIHGDTLENLFEKHLKKPLGYTRSKFNIELDEPNAAVCYRSADVNGLAHPWDDEIVRVMQTSCGNGGQFFTLADIKKFTEAVLRKDERLYPEAMFAAAERQYAPACASESRGLGWLYVDEKYSQTGRLFPTGSFGHCGHTGQSVFFNREKNMCAVILTNATRFLSMRSGFTGYDYGQIMKMREEIHNEIYRDLRERKLLR